MSNDKVIKKLIEQDEQLEKLGKNMATRLDLDEMRTVMDKAMTILERLDQERIFTQEWVKRIENDVDRIKKHLHLV